MRRWLGYVVMAVVGATLSLAWPETQAQRCFPCYRVPNPRNHNPDRRTDSADTLAPPDGRDSSTRPTELPGIKPDPRDYVPPQEIIKSAPGDIAPDEVLPPPPRS